MNVRVTIPERSDPFQKQAWMANRIRSGQAQLWQRFPVNAVDSQEAYLRFPINLFRSNDLC
jgi:hypothetical protein